MSKTKKLKPELIADFIIYTILAVLTIIIVYPLYHMLIVSLSEGIWVLRGEVTLIPIGVNLGAYRHTLSDNVIPRAYLNTLIYTSLGTIIAVAMTALCAYPLSRPKFFGKQVYTRLIIFTMFFRGGIIPRYMVINGLGFINTLWAIVIPEAILVWYLIIMRTFFQRIPNELHESAYLDGANDLTIFARIVIPLSKPVIAVMMLFYAVFHWNSFFPALLYLNSKRMFPMQLIMRNIVISGFMPEQTLGSFTGDTAMLTGMNVRYAVIFITITPILLLYPFIQRYFVKGMLIGSLKG